MPISELTALGAKYGMEYGGTWTRFMGPPHFEFNGGIGNNNPMDYDWPPMPESGDYQERDLPPDFVMPNCPEVDSLYN